MRTSAFQLLTLAGALAFSVATRAQDHQHGQHQHGESHAHKAPHGGTVVTAGNYHIEMVAQGDKITFYLLDGAEKTIPNKGVTGVAMFQFADKKTANMDMTAKGDERFEVVATNAADFTVIVTFTKGEEKITARLTSGPRGMMPAKQPVHNDGHNHQH